jgi:hypothetical protein
MYDYDIEIIEDWGALTLLPQPADAVLEIMIDPGPPLEVVVPGVQGPPGPQGATGTPGAAGAQGVWVSMTQAAYDALSVKDPAVLYVIVG